MVLPKIMYPPDNPAPDHVSNVVRDITSPNPPLPSISSSGVAINRSGMSTTSSTPTGSETTSATTSKTRCGLSPAVIGAIVAGVVLVIVVVAFFFVRCMYVKRRQARTQNILARNAGRDSVAFENSTHSDDMSGPYSVMTESAGSHYSNRSSNARSDDGITSTHTPPRHTPTALTPHNHLRAATLSANAVGHSEPDGPDFRSTLSGPCFAVVPPPSNNGPSACQTNLSPNMSYTLAVMRRPFIKLLPDELSVSVGEVVGIVREFNDGWTLSVTLSEHGIPLIRGMVPSECLKGLSAITVAPRVSSAGQTRRFSASMGVLPQGMNGYPA